MPDTMYASLYVVGLIFAQSLRWYFRRMPSSSPSKAHIKLMNISWSERLVLLSIVLGIWALPLVFIFTDWMQLFDYSLPVELGALGSALFIAGLWLRFRAQKDLEGNWSPSLLIWENHMLVTSGVYRWIRHPLYGSLWIWGISQSLLLHNWLAGLAGIVAVALVYFVRRPREEAMMEAHFGDTYRLYRKTTGSIFPKIRKRDRGSEGEHS